jgi:hypothetical protein
MKRIPIFSLIVLFVFVGLGASMKDENERCDHGDTFDGTIRISAKTSVGKREPYETTINDLLSSLPTTTNLDDNSPRSGKEQQNVTITGWLYAYARETDEDFHLILGSSSSINGRKFFSAEISGLPKDDKSKDYKQLKKARDQFNSIILQNESYCSGFTHKLLKSPLKVTITGSLFFDTHHEAGGSGTSKNGVNYKSTSSWEIHPVTDIKKAE